MQSRPNYTIFSASYRAGSGPPLVCLHGFMDTWRSWDLVAPTLERHHDVLALTLAGHTGGPPIEGPISDAVLADEVERALDAAGIEQAHIVGNSLGGFVALQLAARERARSVVALAPAGGWAQGDEAYKKTLRMQRLLLAATREAVPWIDSMLTTRAGRRRATELITVNFEHIPVGLLTHQLLGVARCPAALALIDFAMQAGYQLDAERIQCPVRVVWGTEDRILTWPDTAVRFREDWLPQADWVVMPDIGHCPQLDVPLQTAQLILGFTLPGSAPAAASAQAGPA